jgi:hypothetical protein
MYFLHYLEFHTCCDVIYAIKLPKYFITSLCNRNVQKRHQTSNRNSSSSLKFGWEHYSGIKDNFLCHPVQNNKMSKRGGRGGQPVIGIREEKEHEGIMGETHEIENATYEDTELFIDKLAQTMKEVLQGNQEIT